MELEARARASRLVVQVPSKLNAFLRACLCVDFSVFFFFLSFFLLFAGRRHSHCQRVSFGQRRAHSAARGHVAPHVAHGDARQFKRQPQRWQPLTPAAVQLERIAAACPPPSRRTLLRTQLSRAESQPCGATVFASAAGSARAGVLIVAKPYTPRAAHATHAIYSSRCNRPIPLSSSFRSRPFRRLCFLFVCFFLLVFRDSLHRQHEQSFHVPTRFVMANGRRALRARLRLQANMVARIFRNNNQQSGILEMNEEEQSAPRAGHGRSSHAITSSSARGTTGLEEQRLAVEFEKRSRRRFWRSLYQNCSSCAGMPALLLSVFLLDATDGLERLLVWL